MTIGMWVIVAIIFVIGLLFSIFLLWSAVDDGNPILVLIGSLCLIITIAASGGIIWFASTSESGKRALKEQQSDLNGGLQRTVTLYSYDGEEIKSWTGKFDVSSSETETYFDIDGKRVIIHGGIVVNEESE